MNAREQLLAQFLVAPGEAARIAERDPASTGGPEFADLAREELEQRAKDAIARGIAELSEAQELLWASDTYALLVVLQAMDAAGKDSVIKHVMSGVNPQGVHVVSFKQPSAEELDHDFLWRIAKALPERGRIGIFNRSHYEDVVALKVHPEWLEAQRLPPGDRGERFWQERYEDINAFERHLDRNGTKVVKFFLHVSKDVQKERFLARLDKPGKEWKFNAADVAERARFDDYIGAFEDALTATSTPWAPWYVIPADHWWVTQALVAWVLVETLRSLDLRWPEVSAADACRQPGGSEGARGRAQRPRALAAVSRARNSSRAARAPGGLGQQALPELVGPADLALGEAAARAGDSHAPVDDDRVALLVEARRPQPHLGARRHGRAIEGADRVVPADDVTGGDVGAELTVLARVFQKCLEARHEPLLDRDVEGRPHHRQVR